MVTDLIKDKTGAGHGGPDVSGGSTRPPQYPPDGDSHGRSNSAQESSGDPILDLFDGLLRGVAEAAGQRSAPGGSGSRQDEQLNPFDQVVSGFMGNTKRAGPNRSGHEPVDGRDEPKRHRQASSKAPNSDDN